MKKHLAVLRIKEIGGKAGFFIVGLLFAMPVLSINNFFVTIHFVCLCLINGAAVYLINAGLGYEQDKSNERLKELHPFKHSSLLIFGFLILLFSLTWLYFFSHKLLLPALVVYGIWVLYSVPKGLKGIPFMGVICGFAAQIFHFHIGYLVFSEWSLTSIIISIYFALLFAGGQALHEVIDYEADKKSEVNTSAVFWGRHTIFNVSNMLFASGAVYLIILAMFKILTVYAIIPYLLAFLIQMGLLYKLPDSWNNDHLFSFRRKYMIAYLFATVFVMMVLYSRPR